VDLDQAHPDFYSLHTVNINKRCPKKGIIQGVEFEYIGTLNYKQVFVLAMAKMHNSRA
jgi:hypothetical protein